MVSVLHKGLEYRVKSQAQEVGGHAAEDQKHSKLPVVEQTIPDQLTRIFTVVID